VLVCLLQRRILSWNRIFPEVEVMLFRKKKGNGVRAESKNDKKCRNNFFSFFFSRFGSGCLSVKNF